MPPRLKPWYTLREWADLTGQTLKAVRRQADRKTLAVSYRDDDTSVGGKKIRVVMISKIMLRNPDLYAALALRNRIK